MQSDEFDRCVEEHREGLMRFCALMVGSEAEEIVQEAVAAAWQGIDGFAGRARFSTWLFGIARNICRKHLREGDRKGASVSPAELSQVERSPRGVLTSVVRHELADRIELCIGRLPQAMREAFVLHYVERWNYADIAVVAEVSEGTARVRAHRARALLRDELGDIVDSVWLQKRP